MKNTLTKYRSGQGRFLATALTALVVGAGNLMAQADSGNAGADAVIDEISGFSLVAVAVVAAAVLIVIVPWGAKMAIKAFKAIVG